MQQVHQEQLNTQSVSATFWRFAVPSIAAMLVNGLYQIVDGFFVGHYIGFQGLAAINIAWPLIGILVGFGVLIGMGRGSLMSLSRGKNAQDEANTAASSAFGLIVFFGLIASLLLSLLGSHVLSLQQAKGDILSLAESYLTVFNIGAMATIGASALPLLVRNDDSPRIATVITLIGAITNIVLDYLFIAELGMGLRGAAIATLLSQLLTVFFGVAYFVSNRSHTKISYAQANMSQAWLSIKIGASGMVMFAYLSFILALHNALLLNMGTALHVSAFAIIGYVSTVYYLIAEGLVSGLQPPVSYYFGSGAYLKVKQTLGIALKWVIIVGLLFIISIYNWSDTIFSPFSNGNQLLINEASHGAKLHLIGLSLDGVIFAVSVFYMAIGRSSRALIVSLGNMFIQLPFLWLLPKAFGINGIWLSVPLSNLAFCLILVPILLKDIGSLGKNAS